MNRAQRRAASKRKGEIAQLRGRTTPKKDKAPTLFATVTDAEGNTHKIPVKGERVTKEQMEAEQRAAAERHEAQMRLRAHVHGLWIPGDEI